jgi:uncharacterized coiled-coil protein SlyX
MSLRWWQALFGSEPTYNPECDPDFEEVIEEPVMNTTNGIQTTIKKYEPHLRELATAEEQIERVRELILEADSMDELGEAFERFGVRKPLYFLQTFARLEDK